MPVHKDPSGQRYVQAEAEVPGTPEDVWRAIATGPGISSWFVPTDLEERTGGSIVLHFGPGMDSTARITEWDPPRRFTAEGSDMGPGSPTVATEWIVEARAGGTCLVRVVHRWFADTDDWDNQFEGTTHGWIAFFRLLRLTLLHFRNQRCTPVQLMAFAPEPKAEAWAALTGPLGLAGVAVGDRVRSGDDAPRLAGVVERAGQPEWPEDLIIRLEQPAPGLVHLTAHTMGGQVVLPIRFFLYGDEAPAIAARTESEWQAWIVALFPAPKPG
ncbi:MAG TPA: SRPBCC domain-containing protein [Gemmatimonadaceae bacterium]|nr:SRPBCC domain-containing protein [Gemmatimonadaceae bacterium]